MHIGETKAEKHCSIRGEHVESAALLHETAASDEIEVAIARANVESQDNMNARVQELESHAETRFTQQPLVLVSSIFA